MAGNDAKCISHRLVSNAALFSVALLIIVSCDEVLLSNMIAAGCRTSSTTWRQLAGCLAAGIAPPVPVFHHSRSVQVQLMVRATVDQMAAAIVEQGSTRCQQPPSLYTVLVSALVAGVLTSNCIVNTQRWPSISYSIHHCGHGSSRYLVRCICVSQY